MGLLSHKKLKKQEKAKVKLKNKEKQLLPKGQNITDLNFKVKKIVIRTQLKDDALQDGPLSSRNLTLQEVLKRLGHYSCSASLEAVTQLEEILQSCSRHILSSYMAAIVTSVSKLITSPHASLRKSAIKLLKIILRQVEENEWSVLKGRVLGHIVCGLSHVEAGVRNDSLVALDSLPSNLSLPSETFLPSLLDLMSTSRPTGSRSLSTPLSSSPTSHRTAVLRQISSVLSHVPLASSSTIEKTNLIEGNNMGCNEKLWDSDKSVNISLTCSFPLNQEGLSISEYNFTAENSSNSLDLKSFALSLIPLMLDSFSEVDPGTDEHEGCQLNVEGMKLLSVIVDILLQLCDILNCQESVEGDRWMKNKFGGQIYKRLIEGRFPYRQETGRTEKNRGAVVCGTLRVSALRLNLILALLAQQLSPLSTSRQISHFLAEIIRNDKLPEEVSPWFEKCLLACLQLPLSKPAANLLSSLPKVKRQSNMFRAVFSVLSKMLLSQDTEGQRNTLSTWLHNLVEPAVRLIDSELLPEETVNLLTWSAPLFPLPSNFCHGYHHLLSNARQVGGDYEVSLLSLLYWMDQWDPPLLNLLQSLSESKSSQTTLTSHLINLVKHRSERYEDGEMNKCLKEHPYWRQI